jgi:glycosyltransferase involved in cell wall biosynthesis
MTEEQKRPTMMVATPMYGGMCTGHYLNGILSLSKRMQEARVPLYYGYLINESLITRARNELARLFLENGLDYLMFIDADIGFDGNAVAQLMAADKDIVCGIYPKKEVDWVAVEKAVAQGKTTGLKDYSGAFVLNFAHELGQELHTDPSGCVEVRHGGTGFMLIKRKVFDNLADKVPSYRPSTVKDANGNYLKPETKEFFATSIDESGCLLSEDYHFCELHRKNGGKIHVNPFIKLEHVGTYVYGGDIIKAGGNLK